MVVSCLGEGGGVHTGWARDKGSGSLSLHGRGGGWARDKGSGSLTGGGGGGCAWGGQEQDEW